jgi:hypothetical protein
MTPPCPGIMSPKSLILKARLKPLPKNPPNGPITEAKIDMKKACNRNGYKLNVAFMPN